MSHTEWPAAAIAYISRLEQQLADSKKTEADLRDHIGSALRVIESFRPLAHAAKAIADDGWPSFASIEHLPVSLAARILTLNRAYEGIADMVADADAEARTSS